MEVTVLTWMVAIAGLLLIGLLAALQLAGSVGMVLGQQWGFLLALT